MIHDDMAGMRDIHPIHQFLLHPPVEFQKANHTVVRRNHCGYLRRQIPSPGAVCPAMGCREVIRKGDSINGPSHWKITVLVLILDSCPQLPGL